VRKDTRKYQTSSADSNTESETNRNAFQQTYLVKPPQILQAVALLMFRVEAIPMFLLTGRVEKTARLIIYLNKLN
jgi:hypothetical protein